MELIRKYFFSSLIVTLAGLIGAGFLGSYYYGTWDGIINYLVICSVLCVLEVSLSFDNAVINATVLQKMTDVWKHRFLTWGMLIAVFGMRLIFPLAIVSIVGDINPYEALLMAAQRPEEYKALMVSTHHQIVAFGGIFLLMVALKYFVNRHKEDHWIHVIEEPLSKIGRLEAVGIAIALVVILLISFVLESSRGHEFLTAGVAGVLTFIAIESLGEFLKAPESDGKVDLAKASMGMFLYLEVLDASFSFDGVIGAFALTNNLFLISIGLGIGAMFVRSLTIMMVERGTLQAYRYLEHGAFYAIAMLAILMILDIFVHIPEVFTGLIGAVIIGASVWASIKDQRKIKA